jgi:hypothetical protein
MNRLMKDLALDQEQNPALAQKWETEEEDEDDDDLDMNLIDRCETFAILPMLLTHSSIQRRNLGRANTST